MPFDVTLTLTLDSISWWQQTSIYFTSNTHDFFTINDGRVPHIPQESKITATVDVQPTKLLKPDLF